MALGDLSTATATLDAFVTKRNVTQRIWLNDNDTDVGRAYLTASTTFDDGDAPSRIRTNWLGNRTRCPSSPITLGPRTVTTYGNPRLLRTGTPIPVSPENPNAPWATMLAANDDEDHRDQPDSQPHRTCIAAGVPASTTSPNPVKIGSTGSTMSTVTGDLLLIAPTVESWKPVYAVDPNGKSDGRQSSGSTFIFAAAVVRLKGSVPYSRCRLSKCSGVASP